MTLGFGEGDTYQGGVPIGNDNNWPRARVNKLTPHCKLAKRRILSFSLCGPGVPHVHRRSGLTTGVILVSAMHLFSIAESCLPLAATTIQIMFGFTPLPMHLAPHSCSPSDSTVTYFSRALAFSE